MKNLRWIIFHLLIPAFALAETYQYELKGAYQLNVTGQRPVAYTLKWSEVKGDIQGSYSDEFFTRSTRVSGEGSDIGRTFIIRLPEERAGVKSITLLSSMANPKQTATAIPISLITRDKLGNPLNTVKLTSNFTASSPVLAAQLQEESRCIEGFGVLAGYCGVYAGTLTEQRDRRNRCNLLFADAVRFELDNDGMAFLHLGEVNELITTPGHSIGRIPVNPQKNSIDLMGRYCGPLAGVNSSSESCKIMHLKGDFSTIRDNRHFSGTYQISEEGTNNVCVYGLSMDQAH